MKKVTIADIAKLANVSRSTVSRYLKKENVNPEMSSRIEQAMEDLNYSVQPVAKVETQIALDIKKDDDVLASIAIICSDVTSFKNNHIISSLNKMLYKNEYTTTVLLTDLNPEIEKRYLHQANVMSASAIIVVNCSSVEYINTLTKDYNMPIIYLQEDEEAKYCVPIDEGLAAEVLGQTLMGRQHLMIRYLGNDVHLANKHLIGIKKAYRKMKQPHDFAVKICDVNLLNAFSKLKEIFADQVDLLILENDALIIPFTKYVNDYHVSVPQNVSMVSFGGSDLTRIMSPVITSVVYDFDIYASDIYAFMQAVLQGSELPERHNMFTLQEGDSVR